MIPHEKKIIIMMMVMTMMIMTIVSVEQRPGWGEHVLKPPIHIDYWEYCNKHHQNLCLNFS